MYIDPEKAHKERVLLKEISRLEGLVYGENKDDNKDLEFVGKVMDSIESNTNELNKLWKEIRAEHHKERSKLNRLLQGIFAALVCIAFLLAYKF